MATRKKFADLRATMAPERRARNAEATKAMLAEMPLNELRRARELSQATLAELLGESQPSVSSSSSVLICTSARSGATSRRWAAGPTSWPISRTGTYASLSSPKAGSSVQGILQGDRAGF